MTREARVWLACGLVSLIGVAQACSSLSRAERVRYGLEGIKASCALYQTYPSEVPRQVELDEICPALDGAVVEKSDAGE